MSDDKNNLVELPAPIREPDATVVKLLEELLRRANEGEITSIAVVGELTNGDMMTSYAGEAHPYTLVGCVEELKLRLLGRPDMDEITEELGMD